MQHTNKNGLTFSVYTRNYGCAAYTNCPACGLEVRIGGYQSKEEAVYALMGVNKAVVMEKCLGQNLANPRCAKCRHVPIKELF